MEIRLLLVSHASSAAQRAGRFPDDEPLDARGLAETEAARLRLSIPEDAAAFVSPAVCARETARALGLAATPDHGLADMNYGRWRGQRLAELALEAPHELAAWAREPDAAPHGGESFSQLVKRVGRWLDALDSASPETKIAASNRLRHVVAVTHAPLLRAAIVHALGASPAVFPRIEIAPLSTVELRRSSRGWAWWPAAV
jgi:broad specificity phosphatase PhoE